jgi:bifunctional DNA-binding transcriptional regulator/antitoxin component of YhaV-PrlF toxin-antitoxin module
MTTVKISSTFKINLPQKICKDMNLKAGQKLILIPIGNSLQLIPRRDINDIRGIMSGANTNYLRDREAEQ